MIRYARFPLLLALLGTVAIAASAVAQTTPTERAAARHVIERIDALQARLDPAEHTIERWRDSMRPVRHTAFLADAKIMAAVLYHFLTDARFRATVSEEHREMAALFDEYLASLGRAYADEIATRTARPPS